MKIPVKTSDINPGIALEPIDKASAFVGSVVCMRLPFESLASIDAYALELKMRIDIRIEKRIILL